MQTVVPGVLTVGIFDQHFRSFHKGSIVAEQDTPPSLRYVDWGCDVRDVDIVMATVSDAATLLDHASAHPRKVLWLQEPPEVCRYPEAAVIDRYDLVLDANAANADDRTAWASLIGTWITSESAEPKTRNVSFLAKTRKGYPCQGYIVREEIAALYYARLYDGFGTIFGFQVLDRKDAALWPYRFHIAVENVSRRYWITEKVWDCFATRTVPLYWGCEGDMSRFAELGFDIAGIMPWHTIAGLKECLSAIAKHGESMYTDMAAAIATNYAVARRLYCAEVYLEPLLRVRFDLQ